MISSINPHHAYAVTALATAVTWIGANTALTIGASLVMIVSGLIAIFNFFRNKTHQGNPK
jgi:hypothetical protein